MTQTIEHFDSDKMPSDNPFYSSRSKREALEALENVWLENLPKPRNTQYSAARSDSRIRSKFGGTVLLSNTVYPRSRSFPDIKLFLFEDEEFRSPKFKNISEEIECSKEILEFEEGWDGYNAPKIPSEIYNRAISFLKKYVKYIHNNSGIVIEAPEINAGINKNVFLSWRTHNARLAISLEYNSEGEIMAHYYGDLTNNKEPIKGNVPTNDVKEHLAYWMKNLY